jgi:hypothetical protein
MRAIYEDNGSGKLTGRQLQELANQLPPEAEILSIQYGESQKDGWFWSIRASVPKVPSQKVNFHYRPSGPKRTPMYGSKDEDGM